MENTDYKFVSIIIPTLNEEIYIKICLESLINLDYPKDRYEIIVVDNGSTDKTVSICKNYTDSIYICPNLNVSGLRNYGAKKAKGDIFAFIDGDCVADKKWLYYAIKSIKLETCVTGAHCKLPTDATWVEKTWALRIPKGRQEVTHVGTANLIVSADIFNKIGGFDDKLKTGEDYEFCMRAKSVAKIIFDDSIKVIHNGNPKTLKQFIKREIWHGLGAFGSLKIKLLDKPFIGTVIFIILTLIQIISLYYIIKEGSFMLFYYSTGGIISLLILTIFYKINKNNILINIIELFALFYMYYFARSISLAYIILNGEYKRRR